MGEVIQMAERLSGAVVKPKTEAHNYKTHRIILSYKPDAPISDRWQWHVKFTRVYEFVGSAATQERSMKAARAKIDSMIERSERVG